METEANLDKILSLVSNPLRRSIIGFLSTTGSLTFSELMEHCGLDIFQQCGLMDYHLKILLDARVLKKEIEYELTDYGKHVAEILDSVRKMDLGGKKMKKKELMPNLQVERFQEKYVEAVARAWMQTFDFDATYEKKALDHFQRLVFGVKDSACFVALVENKVAGFLEGEHTKLGSFYKDYGELGYIHGSNRSWITPEFQKTELRKYVFTKLVEAFTDYFKLVGAYGLFSPDIAPEVERFDKTLYRVLTDQGFYVQNIRYQMRKDFKKLQLEGLDNTRIEQIKKAGNE